MFNLVKVTETIKNSNGMNSEYWLPTKLICKSNLRPRKFNCLSSDYFVQIDITEIPKFNFYFDLYRNEVSTLSLLANNDHWHDSRIINLVVYVCVCTWGGLRFPENDSESSRNFHKMSLSLYKSLKLGYIGNNGGRRLIV